MNRLLLLIILFVPQISIGGAYLEFGIYDGGDTLISAEGDYDYDYFGSFDQDLKAGGGGRLAIGYHIIFGENNNRSLLLSFGYLSDSIDASNGDAEIDAFTADAIYGFHFDSHRLGIGASYHMDPDYEEDLDGFPSFTVEFDNALGAVIQYTYAYTPAFQFGVRYTEMDYEVSNFTIDASSIGLLIAYTWFLVCDVNSRSIPGTAYLFSSREPRGSSRYALPAVASLTIEG